MKKRPHWSLAEVQKLIADDRVAVTHSVCDEFPTRMEAVAWVKEVIGALQPADFAHRVQLETHLADVYGVVVEGGGWYVKLSVTEDAEGPVLIVISCHPAEYPLKTQRGTI